MNEFVRVPVRQVPKDGKWGALQYFGRSHEICAEKVDMLENKYSFAGGHRVRLYRFKDNVHWRIPAGVELDISRVEPAKGNGAAQPPPRRQHDKAR